MAPPTPLDESSTAQIPREPPSVTADPFPGDSLARAALWYARRGIPVSPGHHPIEISQPPLPGSSYVLSPRWACSCDPAKRDRWEARCARYGRGEPYSWCEDQGRHPVLSGVDGGAKAGTLDLSRVQSLWGEHPAANVRLECGARSRLIVLDYEMMFTYGFVVDFESIRRSDWDADRVERERERWERERDHLREVIYPLLCRAWNELRTPMVSTPSGGHIYLAQPPGLKIRSRWLTPACEVLAEGKQVTAAPSRTWVGAYEWFDDRSPEIGLALLGGEAAADPAQREILAALLQLLAGQHAYADARSSGGISLGAAIDGPVLGEGQRRGTLCSIAAQLRNQGSGYGEINDVLQAVNEARCQPPHDPGYVADIARWAAGKAIGGGGATSSGGDPSQAPPLLRSIVDGASIAVVWGRTSATLEPCPLCVRDGAGQPGRAWIWFEDLAFRCKRPECSAGRPTTGPHRGIPLRAWVTLVASAARKQLDDLLVNNVEWLLSNDQRQRRVR